MNSKLYTIITSDETAIDMNKEEIKLLAERIRCGCPNEVLNVIDSVCGLISAQSVCIAESPEGFVVHSWLLNEAMRLERESLQLLSELLQKEGVI